VRARRLLPRSPRPRGSPPPRSLPHTSDPRLPPVGGLGVYWEDEAIIMSECPTCACATIDGRCTNGNCGWSAPQQETPPDRKTASKVRRRRRRERAVGMDMPAPFQQHSPTSREAAMKVVTPGTLRADVLKLITESGGATDEEIQDRLRMNPNTQRPRRRELQQAGLVRDSGDKRTTRAGRYAVVWTTT